MAKKENVPAGVGVFSGIDFTTDTKEEVTQVHNTNTQHILHNTQYIFPETQKEEIRNKRIQIVVKPSLNRKLDFLVKQKKIKSKNDLVNQLLENFVDSLE